MFRRLVLLAALVLTLAVQVAVPATAADKLTAADRQALREFEMNRLFAMLGYLQQDKTSTSFDWTAVGYGEAGNAAVGLTEQGRRLPPVVQELVTAHEKRHGGKNLLGAAAAAAMGGPRGLAKVELDHAIEDVKTINGKLLNEPRATKEEAEALKRHEATLFERFKRRIPGLKPHNGGFLTGGRYVADAFSDPAAIPFFSVAFGDKPLFLPSADREKDLKDAYKKGYDVGRFPSNDPAKEVREAYTGFGGDVGLRNAFRQGHNAGVADQKTNTVRKKDWAETEGLAGFVGNAYGL